MLCRCFENGDTEIMELDYVGCVWPSDVVGKVLRCVWLLWRQRTVEKTRVKLVGL